MITLLSVAGLGIIGQIPLRALAASCCAVIRAPDGMPQALNALLFEDHWYWWLAIGALALTLLWLGNSRQQRRLVHLGFGVGGALLLWVVLARVVTTPAERLYAAHDAILRAANAGRSQDIAAFLAPNFTWSQFDRAAMLASIQTALDNYHVHGNTVRLFRSTLAGRDADAQINILSQTDGGPVITHWELQWHDQPGGDWQITGVAHASFGSGDTQYPLDPSLSPKY